MPDCMRPEEGGTELIRILKKEMDVLSSMLEKQRTLYAAVKERNWVHLEDELIGIDASSHLFMELEDERKSVIDSIFRMRGLNVGDADPMYRVSRLFDDALCADIRLAFREMKRLLLASKIENDSLNKYIATVRHFLQGIFDDVVPQRRNKLYSRRGQIVRCEPESLVLNQSL